MGSGIVVPNARYAIAKYIADPIRMEPRNIGVIVWSEDAVEAQFLGEKRIADSARIDSRSIPSFVTSKSAYRQWVEYWRRAISREVYEPAAGGEAIATYSDRFFDALLESGKGNFILADGGQILEFVDNQNIVDVTLDLFAQLVKASPDRVEPEERNIQRVCDSIIASLHLVQDPNFYRNYRVSHEVVGTPLDVDFDYAYRNGKLRRVYRRVSLTEGHRERENAVLASLYAFKAVLEAHQLDTKNDVVSLVSTPFESDRGADEVESYISALGSVSRVIDVRERDEAVAEFESLKLIPH